MLTKSNVHAILVSVSYEYKNTYKNNINIGYRPLGLIARRAVSRMLRKDLASAIEVIYSGRFC